MGLDIFENEGISEKRCVEIEDWGTLDWDFKKIPFTIYNKYYKMVKSLGMQKLV